MNEPAKYALILLGVAVVLGVIGLLLRAVRWLLYVAIVVLLAAAAVRWLLGGRDRPG